MVPQEQCTLQEDLWSGSIGGTGRLGAAARNVLYLILWEGCCCGRRECWPCGARHGAVPQPLPSGPCFPAWALPAGRCKSSRPEEPQLPAFTLKNMIPRYCCSPEVSHFQMGQLVVFEPSVNVWVGLSGKQGVVLLTWPACPGCLSRKEISEGIFNGLSMSSFGESCNLVVNLRPQH